MDNCFAAIDLGTNSCKLLIADKKGKYLLQKNTSICLGEGMYSSCIISDEAMTRALRCFSEYKKDMEEYKVFKYRAIATAACRKANNSNIFTDVIEDNTGIKLDIIDGYEEAKLNLLGALSNAEENKKYVTLFDIGGGSTEVTLATNSKNPDIIYSVSIPWGARNSSEAFGMGKFDKNRASKLEVEVLRYVENFLLNSNYEKYKNEAAVVATSSSALRLVSIQNKYSEYDREKADGKIIDAKNLDPILTKIYSNNLKELAENPLIGEKRANIFVPGCVIFDTISKGLEAKKITASLKSAKDGIIKQLVDENNSKLVHSVLIRKKKFSII